MFKKILNSVLVISAIFAIFFAHIAISYLMPSPYFYTNIIFACVVLFIVWWESGWVVWISFFLFFLVELYSSMPFGLVLIASTMSVLVVYWLYKDVITNHSLMGAVLLSILSIILFRFFYIALMLLFSTVGLGAVYSIRAISIPFLWETLFTSVAVFILYIIFNPFLSSVRVKKA